MELEAPVACPACKRGMKIKVKDMVPGRKKKCSACGAETTFSGDDGRKTQKALDDLQKKMKTLFKQSGKPVSLTGLR
jgi:hypothetical protein